MPREPRYAPDGSPVELYAALGPLGEPELVHAAIPPGAAILELGAGAGRLTHALLELGHPVVAVDQSAAMLSHIVGAETVRGDIESLDLGRRFPVVLLASNSSTTRTVSASRRTSAPASGTSSLRAPCSSKSTRGTGNRTPSGASSARCARACAGSLSTERSSAARWSTSSRT